MESKHVTSDLGVSLSPLGRSYHELSVSLRESVASTDDPLFRAAAGALALSAITVAATGSSFGECTRTTPYAPLHPVIDHDGHFKWCCNHSTQHCSKAGDV
jgi:hypothetical protein